MKKALCSLLAVIMALCLIPPAAYAATFSDISGHWGEAAIERWAAEGVMSGYADGTYRPAVKITRADLARALNNIMKYQVRASNSFSDLSTAHPDYDALLKLNAAGVMEGYANKMRPDENITREEAITMIARAFNVEQYDGGVYTFADSSLISSWAKPHIGGLRSYGFVEGWDGKFHPKELISRAEMAKLLDNMISEVYSRSGTYSLGSQSGASSNNSKGFVIINTPGVTLRGATAKGDLLIAPGVGTGNITLEDVSISGRLIIEGGGQNSVHLRGSTNSSSVRINKKNGPVRVVLYESASVGTVYVENDSDTVYLEGTGQSLEIGENTRVNITSGKFDSISMSGSSSTLTVGSNAIVKSANLDSDYLTLTVNGQISEISVGGSDTNINGSGGVNSVSVHSGYNNKVTVPGASIEVYSGAGSVSTGAGSIAAGYSGKVPGTGNWTSSAPSIEKASYVFNLKAPADIVMEVNLGSGIWAAKDIVAVKNSGIRMTVGTDYKFTDGKLTIFQSYLSHRLAGTHTLTVSFDDTQDTDVQVTIEVYSKTIISTLTGLSDITAPALDAAAPTVLNVTTAANFTAAIEWSGLTDGKFVKNSTATATVTLTSKSDYTFNNTTISAATIKTLFKAGTPTVLISGTPDDKLVFTLSYAIGGPPPLAVTSPNPMTVDGASDLRVITKTGKTAYQPGEKVDVTVTLGGADGGAPIMTDTGVFTVKLTSGQVTSLQGANAPTKQILAVKHSTGDIYADLSENTCTFTFNMPETAVSLSVICDFKKANATVSPSSVEIKISDVSKKGSVNFSLTTSNIPSGTSFEIYTLPEHVTQSTKITASTAITPVILEYDFSSVANPLSSSTNLTVYIGDGMNILTHTAVMLNVVYTPPVIITTIDDLGGLSDLSAAPAYDDTAPTSLAASGDFTASIAWGGLSSGKYVPNSTAVATVTLTAKTNYTFTGTAISQSTIEALFSKGSPAAAITGNTGSTLTFTLTYPIGGPSITKISTVSISTPKPAATATSLDTTTAVTGTSCAVKWKAQDDSTWAASIAKFEPDTVYLSQYVYTITAAYTEFDTSVFTVGGSGGITVTNGGTAKVTAVSASSLEIEVTWPKTDTIEIDQVHFELPVPEDATAVSTPTGLNVLPAVITATATSWYVKNSGDDDDAYVRMGYDAEPPEEFNTGGTSTYKIEYVFSAGHGYVFATPTSLVYGVPGAVDTDDFEVTATISNPDKKTLTVTIVWFGDDGTTVVTGTSAPIRFAPVPNTTGGSSSTPGSSGSGNPTTNTTGGSSNVTSGGGNSGSSGGGSYYDLPDGTRIYIFK